MGIGPGGPPIPPPVTLSIVPFPKSRPQDDEKQICACFTFLIPSKSDEAKRDSEEDEPSPAKVKRMSAKMKKYTQICSDCKICEIKMFASANVGDLRVKLLTVGVCACQRTRGRQRPSRRKAARWRGSRAKGAGRVKKRRGDRASPHCPPAVKPHKSTTKQRWSKNGSRGSGERQQEGRRPRGAYWVD